MVVEDFNYRKAQNYCEDHHNKYQKIVTQLATNLINVPYEKLDEEIEKTLRIVGQFCHAERAYVFRYDFDNEIATNTHEWCNDNKHPRKHQLQSVPLLLLAEKLKLHKKNIPFHVHDAALLPNSSVLKRYLVDYNIATLISFPLYLQGECFGSVCIESSQKMRKWTKKEIDLMAIFSNVLANINLRYQILTVLRKNRYNQEVERQQQIENEQRFRTYFEKAPLGIFIVNGERRYVDINSAACSMLGYSRNELLEMRIGDLESQEYKGIAFEQFARLRMEGEIRGDLLLSKKNGESHWFHLVAVKIHSDEYVGFLKDINERKLNEVEKEQRRLQLNKELEMAKAIQFSLLPKHSTMDKLEFIGALEVSNKLSGDFYYWQRVSQHEYVVLLIDIMGHGICSSFVGMTIRSIIPTAIQHSVEPKKIMQYLNAHMVNLYTTDTDQESEIRTEYYFTGICCLINVQSQILRYVNASHPPMILIDRHNNNTKLTEINGPAGLFANTEFREGVLPFLSNQRLLMYSDGYLETLLNNHNPATFELLSWVRGQNVKSSKKTLENLLDPVRRSKGNLGDDVTLLIISHEDI